MEARATINGASVSKTFVAAVLVLVAMGLGAMGGYAVKGLGGSGAPAAGASQVQYHIAPGTFLHEDLPQPSAEPNRIQKDDVLNSDSSLRGNRGGTRGTHGEI